MTLSQAPHQRQYDADFFQETSPEAPKTECFAHIPNSILEQFGVEVTGKTLPAHLFPERAESYRNVVAMFVDGYGWAHHKQESELLESMRSRCSEALLSRVNSQFPSITQSHISTMHTGKPVWETGIVSEKFFAPSAGRLVRPYELGRDGDAQDLNMQKIFGESTFYEAIEHYGIKSYVFQQKKLADDPLAQHFWRGAEVQLHENLHEGLDQLSSEFNRPGFQRRYFFWYWPSIDSKSHEFGPASDEVKAESKSVLSAVKVQFLDKITPRGDTLILLFSDHGHIDADMSQVAKIDLDLPEIQGLLRRDANGAVIPPGGSFREKFFYAKEGSSDELYEILKKAYTDRAAILKQADFFESVWPDSAPSKEARASIGDVILIAKDRHVFAWSGTDEPLPQWKGFHGGLHPEETQIPFLAIRI